MRADELADILRAPDASEVLTTAAGIRDEVFGREVFQRGVVELSTHCRKNCRYCGLRRDNGRLARFSMSDEDIVAAAGCAVRAGMGTVVLQSGEEGLLPSGASAGLCRRSGNLATSP